MEFTPGSDWLYGDFTDNGIVDMEDLPAFADIWLLEDCNDLDLDDNCLINIVEFSAMAENWLLQ